MTETACIFGLAAGYHYGDVRPFLLSLEKSGYTGECVLFVSETTRDLERMGGHGATLVPFERSSGLAHLPINALRYFLYLDFLRAFPGEYGRVLITDVRDVIFQRDPLSFDWTEGLNVTLEDRRMTLGACPYNSHWIRSHLGEEALQSVSHAPISCSGTTVGGHQAMLGYLEAMTSLLVPFAEGEQKAGYDQGVHNYLIHTGRIPDLTLHDNAGPILTLGYTEGEPPYDSRGYVLNELGERAHLVHQYDRKPELFKAVRQHYA
ncbi:hypothetical protein GM415_00580 [Pseudodesulfovibrio cashew]|uniref:Uncharacterized protein n=1 Tax=Pseudodesulfovibrio cashew TaxID=2678688 RepID=A0A6I6J820_9BACT|nr:hypothetical protein [Pseudodesulfovibrio cashew]QGY38695.1 hypothetical protein GM415_00580 [Pseudodesulfovibrio cashew]